LSATVIDTVNSYVRKLNKASLEEKDFLSHWERNKKPEILECENICSFKAISLNQFRSDTEAQIVEKFKTTFSINPKKGSYYLKFQFLNDAGKIKYTPFDNDASHYDFYKADDFNLEKIHIIETVKFA
jgi:hypothetical protein